MSCRKIADVDGSGKQTRWTLQGFVLVRGVDGEYVFRSPDEGGVTIIVRTDSVGFEEMTKRELGVKLVFKEGKFEPLDKMPLEERQEREADEKYREERGIDFDGKPIVYPDGIADIEEGS